MASTEEAAPGAVAGEQAVAEPEVKVPEEAESEAKKAEEAEAKKAEEEEAEAKKAEEVEADAKKAEEEKPKKERKPRTRKPRSAGPHHPPYFEMIKEAILALHGPSGSSPYAIAKYIGEQHRDVLPANYRKVLAVQLKNFAAKGKLVKVKASFKLAESEHRVAERKRRLPPAAAKEAKKPAARPPRSKKARKAAPAKPKQPKSIRTAVAKKAARASA